MKNQDFAAKTDAGSIALAAASVALSLSLTGLTIYGGYTLYQKKFKKKGRSKK